MIVENVDIDGSYEDLHSPGDNYIFACRRLATKINFIRNKYQLKNRINFGCLYIPHTILNILSDTPGFSFFVNLQRPLDEVEPVGVISGMDVYLMIEMPRDEILFSFDKSIVRENKIESLLGGDVDPYLNEVILKVKSEFI